jgi:CDP-6-deoxy-D-xylo-4-hexulose-3-dehydrase
MVNSGSSANLIAMAALTNLQNNNRLKYGDKVIVPGICWSTSIFPILQFGLIPVIIDVDPLTMNIDIKKLKQKINEDKCIKGIVLVHVLGNCANMDDLMNIVSENNLFLLEDTCESLGSSFGNKKLGSFGNFGTFSFYYSHHITTIEGGMVICNNENDYELIKCLRAHGWTRNLKKKEEYEKKYESIDKRFLFVNLGYNLRPMEIQGKMGISQLTKLDFKNKNRIYNHDTFVNLLLNDKRNKNIFLSPIKSDNSYIAWFGIVIIINEEYKHHLKKYIEHLNNNSVETRPIISGNITQQPVFELYNIEYDSDNLEGTNILHERAFFIGSSCEKISTQKINDLINIFYDYNFTK